MTDEEWKSILDFLTIGGSVLKSYEEFHKVVVTEDGLYKVNSRKIAMLHRMNMGVIVSDAMLKVKFISGGYIGMVEEYFISKLKKDEKFILAGRVLEVAMIKDMTVYVRAAKGKAFAPSYLGGRLPLSSNLGQFLRQKLSGALNPKASEKELKFLHPLLINQEERSHIPKDDEFLVELIKNREGYHLFMYPFEGRLVHEVMSALIAYRISKLAPISFSMAMNDYGFELFSDKEIPLNEENLHKILTRENLMTDVISSINSAEMARRKFRDIAVISGMVIQNYAGKQRSNKSLQSSAGLIFKVLEDYDPNHFLVRQAYTEVFNAQLQEQRLVEAFKRIEKSKIILKFANTFTPLSFPIQVFAYDLLELEGNDLREKPIAGRRAMLEELLLNENPENIKISQVIDFENWNELDQIRENSREINSEGLMLKQKNSHYHSGRKKGDWWKWKINPLTIDAVLIYAQKGSGRRSAYYTDYTFAVKNEDKLVTIAKAYSGLTDKEIMEVSKFVNKNAIEKFGPVRTVKPELVFEIAFEGIGFSNRHKSGVALRFPRILRWRKDKTVDEIDDLEEIKKLIQ